MRSNFENVQKVGQRGRDPINATNILNLQTVMNIFETAKATGFKLSNTK